MNPQFWRGKRVLVTGHTGFKGSWLVLWLQALRADVVGFALAPPSSPSLFDLADAGAGITDLRGDIRNFKDVRRVVEEHQPEIIFHMAAQPLVRRSYLEPLETYATNVMGTVHLFEALRQVGGARVIINVTSDKCYENKEQLAGYAEDAAMGGYDPYSSSKGCAELVTAAYRRSFFSEGGSPAMASCRAGNVIGGGDWAADRLIPDMIRAILAGEAVSIRNPHAIRPWQHVLEPLSGYMRLAELLWSDKATYAEGWNFGPLETDAQPVQWIVERIVQLWGPEARWELDGTPHPHEAHYLKLDCTRARTQLGWEPRWNLVQALARVVEWYRGYQQGQDIRALTLRQIEAFTNQQDEQPLVSKVENET